ncbi:hypothetical protein FBQ96_10690 [Nitrospirales bacterium NOB]|nr:hypothetical protein [Nitrospirales bacterium NOB]
MITLRQAIEAARREFGWADDFYVFLKFDGERVVNEFQGSGATQEELCWIEEYAAKNGGWAKREEETFCDLDIKSKTVREIMTHKDEEGDSLYAVVFESFRDPERPELEYTLSFELPRGEEGIDDDIWDSCEVEVSIWKKDADNPDRRSEVAEIRLGPYPLSTLAEPLAAEARANIPIARAQLTALPDGSLSMYLALKRATKVLSDTLGFIDKNLEKHADMTILEKTRVEASKAAKTAVRQDLEERARKQQKDKYK